MAMSLVNTILSSVFICWLIFCFKLSSSLVTLLAGVLVHGYSHDFVISFR